MGVGQSHEDTIVAIASPHGPGIRGIVRLSGPQTVQCVANSFNADCGSEIGSLTETDLVAGFLNCDGIEIPGNLLIWPTEKSFTKQPSAEFHTFGSTSVLELAVAELCQHGARPAEPGEFTMRAFLSGRLDLTQAEAVLAVIDAKNRKQLDVAIDQLAGGMGSRLTASRNELVAALAELEAGLDFVEEDIEFISNDAMIAKLQAGLDSIRNLLTQLSDRDAKNDRFRVSLFGVPNAGKSSLFNCLAGEELAIVSDVQGTTTDRVSVVCKIATQNIELVDTAGVEVVDTPGSIQSASQQHRQLETKQSDLAVLCISAAEDPTEIETQLLQLDELNCESVAIVLTQIDRIDSNQLETIKARLPESIHATSAADGVGIDELREMISQKMLDSQTSESAIIGSTMLRTGQSLQEAEAAIESAIDAANNGIGEEVVASEVRAALDCIGLIVGTIYTDDILDVVFGKFCIGK